MTVFSCRVPGRTPSKTRRCFCRFWAQAWWFWLQVLSCQRRELVAAFRQVISYHEIRRKLRCQNSLSDTCIFSFDSKSRLTHSTFGPFWGLRHFWTFSFSLFLGTCMAWTWSSVSGCKCTKVYHQSLLEWPFNHSHTYEMMQMTIFW